MSVIIPTFNAGAAFENTISGLKIQKGISQIEIIIVDSGSTDCTLDVCEKYQLTILKINHSDFSHSYARNLGASHAKGDILVFMVQDASPIGDAWLLNLISPIATGEVAACTLNEENPEGTEFFYRVATRSYAAFLGTLDGDRLNSYSGDEDFNELRRKASLTDMSCAVKASVFRKFKYRGSFAEDLDLGVRLLKNGYSIKILSSTKVLHGHNRTCGYYIRRSFVDEESLRRIFSNRQNELLPEISIHAAALRVVSAAEMVYALVEKLETSKSEFTIDAFRQNLLYRIDQYINNEIMFENGLDCVFDDKFLDFCVTKCKEYVSDDLYFDCSMLRDIRNYINNCIFPFIETQNINLVNKELENDICTCILKQFAVLTGATLARIKDPDEREKFSEYMCGI